MYEQLLFFQESKEDKIEREIEKLKQSSEKVRKGIYAKHTELYKMYLDQKHELEILKAAICRSRG